MALFQRRTKKEKFAYHRENEKRILAKTKGIGMTPGEREARSAGWIACAREHERNYIWANATAPEREALNTLGKDKTKKQQLWALQRQIKDRVKAANLKKAK